MGYGGDQIADLEETINNTAADLVLIATPIDLGRIINIRLPWQRVRYSLQEIGQPTLKEVLRDKLALE
jgi:predicted GTPase